MEGLKELGGAEYMKKHMSRFHNPSLGWAPPEQTQFLLQGSGRYARTMQEETYYRYMKTFANRND